MGRPIGACLLACLLVLAGCSGFSGAGPDSGGSDASRANVTPAPVPAVDTPERLAPGLTADGVTNASALADAHDAAVRRASVTVRSNRSIEYANGTLRQRTTGTVRVGRNGTAYAARYEFTGRPLWLDPDSPDIVRTGYYWSAGERTLRTVAFANETTRYEDLSAALGASVRRSLTRPGQEYERLLEDTETRVIARTTRNGRELYVVEASGMTSQYFSWYRGFENPRDATMRLLVDERGVVRRHRFAYTATIEATATVRIVERVRYTDLGNTTVERPPWYDEALRATNGTDVGDANTTATTSASIDASTSSATSATRTRVTVAGK